MLESTVWPRAQESSPPWNIDTNIRLSHWSPDPEPCTTVEPLLGFWKRLFDQPPSQKEAVRSNRSQVASLMQSQLATPDLGKTTVSGAAEI